MDEVQFIGTLIVVCVPLIGSVVALIRPFLKATVDLNTTITKLNDKLDQVFCQNEVQDKRLTAHGQRLDKLEHDVTVHGVRIDHLEREKEKEKEG